MIVYVLLLAAATQETEYKPEATNPYIFCADGTQVLLSQPCLGPVTFSSPPQADEVPLAEALRTNPRVAIPVTSPGTWVTTDDYPGPALREEREGISGFKLAVGVDGKVSSCLITASSGSPDLDTATCANITRRARFYPATDKKGRPIASSYSNRVTWRIPKFAAYNYNFDGVPTVAYPRSPVAKHYLDWPEAVDYPASSTAAGQEGEALVALTIDELGKVVTCEIAKTSGFNELDDASCPFVSANWTFKPALNFDGQPTKGRIETPVGWYLAKKLADEVWEEAARKPNANVFKDPGKVTLQFELDAKGQPLNCKVETQGIEAILKEGGANMFDLCRLFSQPGMVTFEPFVGANGKAESRIIFVEIELKHLPALK